MKELENIQEAFNTFITACEKMIKPTLTPEQEAVEQAFKDGKEIEAQWKGGGGYSDLVNKKHCKFDWLEFTYRVKEAKPTRWMPKVGYFVINHRGKICPKLWYNSGEDIELFNAGNCYQTEAKAEASDDWKMKNGEWEYYFAGLTDIDTCDIDWKTLKTFNVITSKWDKSILSCVEDINPNLNHKWLKPKAGA